MSAIPGGPALMHIYLVCKESVAEWLGQYADVVVTQEELPVTVVAT